MLFVFCSLICNIFVIFKLWIVAPADLRIHILYKKNGSFFKEPETFSIVSNLFKKY